MNLNLLKDVDGIYRVEQKGKVKFLHADNMKFLEWCFSQSMFKYFHVGIVDPPYGIDVTKMNLGATKDSKPKNYERGEWDGEIPTQRYWNLLNYVCRNLIVWGGNYFTNEYGKIAHPQDNELIGLPAGRCFVVWDKGNDKMSFAPCELAITTFDKNACFIRKSRNAQEQDGDKRHDTQKPVYVYDYLHLNFVEKNHRVLDTHGGSFSHAIAAYKNNVDLTIMDKCESYVNRGIEAYDKQATPGRLAF